MDDDDMSDSDEERNDQMPGPGHYYNGEKFSSIKKQFKQEKFQFFGTSQDRFKGSIFQGDQPHKGTPIEVGPGSYDTSKNIARI